MSGYLVDAAPHSHIKVRWDVTPGAVTVTQDDDEIDIPVDNIDEFISALKIQKKAVEVRNE